MIYCFGNSHTSIFTGRNIITPIDQFVSDKNQYFNALRLGPSVAYNFTSNYLPRVYNHINKSNIPSGSRILLAIGEIDCRWHIPLNAEKNHTTHYEEVKKCINRFYQTVVDLKSNGFKPIVWGVHPATNKSHSNNKECPIYGEFKLRLKITRQWNRYIERLCRKDNIEFISLCEDILDNNQLKEEYFMDTIHLAGEKVYPLILDAFNKYNVSYK